MVDVKKLITGFLVLATIVSSLAFLFSRYAPTIATSPDEAQINFASQDPPPVPANAFVEPIPSVAYTGNIVAPSDGQTADLPTSNVTESLARSVVQGVIEANPQGPYDADGNLTIAQPDVNALLEIVPNDPVVKKLSIPDWEADVNAIKFNVVANPGEDDVNHYNAALQNIFETYFVQNDIVDFAATDGTDFDRLGGILGDSLKVIEATPVPVQFASFHKSAAKVLLYMRNALDLAKNASDDPMKAALIFSAQEKNYNQMIVNLQNEFSKVKLSGVFSESREPSGLLAVANFILGVKTAHAFYPTWDFPSFSTFLKNIADDIKTFIKDSLLQLLKQTVVKRIMNDTVAWIQGGASGKPLFIENWKGFLHDTYNAVTAATIGEFMPNLCQAFRMPVQIAMNNTFRSGINGYFSSGCTLDRLVGDIRGFYQNFETGGWIAYGQTAMPSGNYYGNLFLTESQIRKKAQDSASAAKSGGVASKGFLSVTKCPAGFTESAAGACSQPDPDRGPGFYKFADPVNLTPGAAVADQLQNAFKGPGEAVTNTNNSWASLFTTFVGQMIDSLINLGLKDLRNAAQF